MRPAGRRGSAGYILLETVVGLALLSIAAYAVHGTMRQALETRGQAQDYTRVRFLLEELIAREQLDPFIREGVTTGQFPPPNERFHWRVEVRPVKVPEPPKQPPHPNRPDDFDFKYTQPYLAHVRATVTWSRFGRDFQESMETLFEPGKLPVDRDRSFQ